MYIELKSVQQEVPAEPTLSTENKQDAGLALEVGTESIINVNADQEKQKRYEDDNTDEAATTDETPDHKAPEEAAKDRDGDKNDNPQVPGGEICEEFCIEKSEVDAHKQHTWKIDIEDGEKVDGGSSNCHSSSKRERLHQT